MSERITAASEPTTSKVRLFLEILARGLDYLTKPDPEAVRRESQRHADFVADRVRRGLPTVFGPRTRM